MDILDFGFQSELTDESHQMEIRFMMKFSFRFFASFIYCSFLFTNISFADVVAKIGSIEVTSDDIVSMSSIFNDSSNDKGQITSRLVLDAMIAQAAADAIHVKVFDTPPKTTDEKIDAMESVIVKWLDYSRNKIRNSINKDSFNEFYKKISAGPYYEISFWTFETKDSAVSVLSSFKSQFVSGSSDQVIDPKLLTSQVSSGSRLFLIKLHKGLSLPGDASIMVGTLSPEPFEDALGHYVIWRVSGLDRSPKPSVDISKLDKDTVDQLKDLFIDDGIENRLEAELKDLIKNVKVTWIHSKPVGFDELVKSFSSN